MTLPAPAPTPQHLSPVLLRPSPNSLLFVKDVGYTLTANRDSEVSFPVKLIPKRRSETVCAKLGGDGMPTEIRVWEIRNDGLVEVEEKPFSEFHKELELEDWIARKPGLLGEDLLVVGRQLDVPGVGRLDLLCIDSSGKLVIVELKRELGPREAVAQALDYASWLDGESPERITNSASAYLKRDLEDAFRDHFGQDLSNLDTQDHRIILVAPKLDDSAERIINYLAKRYDVDMNAVFFTYRKLTDGKEVLIRSVLVPDYVHPPTTGRRPTEAQLLAMSNGRNTQQLVEICRTVKTKNSWVEEPARTAGGSFRYWARRPDGGSRMVFGINVAGKLGALPGELVLSCID